MRSITKVAVIASIGLGAFVTVSFNMRPALASESEHIGPRALYIQNCARCHGLDGRSNTAKGRKLEAVDLTSTDVQAKSAASIARAIRNGRVNMPAFSKRLSEKQIVSIAEYVRSL